MSKVKAGKRGGGGGGGCLLPGAFRPVSPDDLIGPAGTTARALIPKMERLRREKIAAPKILFYGPPGTGKTALAEMLAATLAPDEPCAVEHFNGREVGSEQVRRWMESLAYAPMFGGGWSVRIINELDCASREAQELLLTYLDRLRPGRALIATSNLRIDLLTERLQTRFQVWNIQGPETAQIERWLVGRWKAPAQTARAIAQRCKGCVRAALCDLESAFDMMGAEA
jgi:replication-associated recombination protein RarA